MPDYLDLNNLDFDAMDDLDDAVAADYREITTGLPARPGTRR